MESALYGIYALVVFVLVRKYLHFKNVEDDEFFMRTP